MGVDLGWTGRGPGGLGDGDVLDQRTAGLEQAVRVRAHSKRLREQLACVADQVAEVAWASLHRCRVGHASSGRRVTAVAGWWTSQQSKLPQPTAARRVAAETLWARAKEHPAIARHPTLVGWLDDERAAGRLPAEPATRARVLGEALDVLAVLPDEGTGLARVATGVLGYAHALNAGTVPAAVLRAAEWLAGEPATAPSSEMRRRLWASLGVATDMVSSTVLVLGVTLVGDSPLAVSLAAHAAAGVPMRVTLGQLVHHVERAELRGPRRVWACENPSVVEAADRLGARCGPLVCTEGRPSVAACRLLAGLTRAGTELRYHGDFDWAGLDIAAGVSCWVDSHGG